MDSFSIAFMNIAMIKYWCKDKYTPYLRPLVSSLSILAKNMYTKTKIEKSEKDIFVLNDVVQDEFETKKVFSFVDKVVNRKEKLKISSINTMPTAAGLASSSSAYAALTMELNRYFDLKLTRNMMAKISSQGSGSSARSFYNICAYTKDCNIYEVPTNLDLLMLAIIVSSKKKKISSRDAMNICKNTSRDIRKWERKNKVYFLNAKKALKENDFDSLGINMEKSTEFMHKTMLSSKPSFTYLTPRSKEIIAKIKELRKKGLNIYYTTDAGPNVKVLLQSKDKDKVINILKSMFKEKVVEC